MARSNTRSHMMRTERYKRTVFWDASAQPTVSPRPAGAGHPAPPPNPTIQPLGEGTGGASGATEPLGEAGVSAGGSGLAGV